MVKWVEKIPHLFLFWILDNSKVSRDFGYCFGIWCWFRAWIVCNWLGRINATDLDQLGYSRDTIIMGGRLQMTFQGTFLAKVLQANMTCVLVFLGVQSWRRGWRQGYAVVRKWKMSKLIAGKYWEQLKSTINKC